MDEKENIEEEEEMGKQGMEVKRWERLEEAMKREDEDEERKGRQVSILHIFFFDLP